MGGALNVSLADSFSGVFFVTAVGDDHSDLLVRRTRLEIVHAHPQFCLPLCPEGYTDNKYERPLTCPIN